MYLLNHLLVWDIALDNLDIYYRGGFDQFHGNRHLKSILPLLVLALLGTPQRKENHQLIVFF
jgi:hypothetical protein